MHLLCCNIIGNPHKLSQNVIPDQKKLFFNSAAPVNAIYNVEQTLTTNMKLQMFGGSSLLHMTHVQE